MTRKKVIPGIHNYCDRWCERCYFTSHCSVYEGPKDVSPEEKDINNKAFWDKLTKNFQQAITMLHQAAAAHGIDLKNIPQEELDEIHAKQEQVRRESDNHPLNVISLDYSQQSLDWFNDKTIITQFEDNLNSKLSLGILTHEAAQQQADTIKDCIEIIDWYLHFIPPKINRAIAGKIEDDGWEEENGFQKDSDGSAKIALIAIDRSIQAWLQLYKLIPEAEDDCLKMLAQLQKIKNLTEEEFPNASKFVRPGFDEENPEIETLDFPD